MTEEISSPELVLVSPPELAALAREALPDYEVEFERWVVEIRAAFAAEAARRDEPRPGLVLGPEWELEPDWELERYGFAALAFTTLSAVACVAPLVLLLLSRSL